LTVIQKIKRWTCFWDTVYIGSLLIRVVEMTRMSKNENPRSQYPEFLYISADQDKIVQCIQQPCDHVWCWCLECDSGIRNVWMHLNSGVYSTFSPSRVQPMSVILKSARELDSLRLQHSSSRDDSNCSAMLPELTKLKITTVHCEHLSTHLVTGDGRQDVLVRPGYQLSALNPPGNWRRPRGRPRQTWLPTISSQPTW